MDKNEQDPRSFEAFLASVNDGVLLTELGDKLVELTAAMWRQAESSGGKPKGKLSISFDFVLDRGVMDINADVSVKLPKTVRGRSIMFLLPGGGLSLKNPKQTEIEFAPRDVVATPVRTLEAVR